MTAQSTSPALNLRKSLVRLAGLVRRFDPPLRRVDFANLVTNGGFDADSDWTKGTGWTISGGVAVAVSVPNGQGIVQSAQMVAGRRYLLGASSVALSAANATASFLEDFVASDWFSGGGQVKSVAKTYRGSGNRNIQIGATNGTMSGSFDNVSVWEADPSDDAPWLRLPFGHKVGNRGMIVRDGDTLHPSDYEEITLYGQTFIKPLVAPGVDTEFSIWCSPSE